LVARSSFGEEDQAMALISKIIGDCPSCGFRRGFGNVGVHGDHVLRRCKSCEYKARIPLPAIQKKIVYLDQSLLSSAFREQDASAVQLIDAVARLATNQLVVAPYSSVHEDETHLLAISKPEVVDDLMDFIKQVAGGVEFKAAYDVEHAQVFDAYSRFRSDGHSTYELERRQAFDRDINTWTDYLFIDLPGYFGDPVVNEKFKQAALAQLLDAIETWRSSELSFEEAFRLEINSAGQVYVDSYIDMLRASEQGDPLAFLNAPMVTAVVQGLIAQCDEEEIKRRISSLPKFFASTHFSECPYQWLSARMFAVLRHQVRTQPAFQNRGKAEGKLRGFCHDVRHIATYAPYCDAIFVDNAMAHILKDKRIRLTERYGTRVFSMRNKAEFKEWLDQVENTMDDTHRAGLAAAYPPTMD
jgi:hypothetical protein